MDDDEVCNPPLSVFGDSGPCMGVCKAFVLLLVFGIGKAGNADVGGPYEGLDGLGRVAVIISGFKV